jgi:hypothetical protein
VGGPLDYLFGWWRSYQFQIWSPLPPEQAAAQLERSLVNRWLDAPGPGRLALRGSVVMDRFSLMPRDFFGRQRPTIRGHIVNAPGGGSHIVGELAYGLHDKALGAAVPVIMIGSFGSCGIRMIVSAVPSPSTWIDATVCAGMPMLVCLVVLRSQTVRTSTYHARLRAHLCSVLGGVDVTVPAQSS